MKDQACQRPSEFCMRVAYFLDQVRVDWTQAGSYSVGAQMLQDRFQFSRATSYRYLSDWFSATGKPRPPPPTPSSLQAMRQHQRRLQETKA